MFSNKWNQINISKRNQKNLKFSYKSKVLENFLTSNNFTLFYYYDSWSNESTISLKNILKEENLQYTKIKKNILNNSAYHNLSEILKNNTIFITSKENCEFTINFLTKLNNIKNIHFIGLILNKKFLRPFEIKKINLLNAKKVNQTTFKTLHFNLHLLKKTIALKQAK
jgi:ribosomal protein L10